MQPKFINSIVWLWGIRFSEVISDLSFYATGVYFWITFQLLWLGRKRMRITAFKASLV